MKIFPAPRHELDLFALYFLVSFVCMPLFLQLAFSIAAFFTPLPAQPYALALTSPWISLSVLIGGISVVVMSQRMGITFRYSADFRYWVYGTVATLALYLINKQLGENVFQSGSFTARGFDPWQFAFLVLLAPIFEEYVFRGLLHAWLSKRYAPAISATLTTAAFLLMHFQVFFGLFLDALAILLLGILLIVLRVWSKALGPAMLVHCLNNGLSLLG